MRISAILTRLHRHRLELNRLNVRFVKVFGVVGNDLMGTIRHRLRRRVYEVHPGSVRRGPTGHPSSVSLDVTCVLERFVVIVRCPRSLKEEFC